MIVIDEQLLGRALEHEIAKWYPGAVCFVTDLRPGSVIKDDAIPALLRQEKQPNFITINERDFWRKIPLSLDYCVICFALSDARAHEIPARLRVLFQHPLFDTQAKRMGTAIRIAEQGVSYYTVRRKTVETVET